MTITLAKPTAALVIEAPTEYRDQNYETASWFDEFVLEPGVYPFEWVNINHTPWNADDTVATPGYVGNVGPYYAKVKVAAILTREYRVSRLFTASSVTDERFHHGPRRELTRSVYAYQIPGCPKGQHGRPLTEFMGGIVALLDEDGQVRPACQPTGRLYGTNHRHSPGGTCLTQTRYPQV